MPSCSHVMPCQCQADSAGTHIPAHETRKRYRSFPLHTGGGVLHKNAGPRVLITSTVQTSHDYTRAWSRRLPITRVIEQPRRNVCLVLGAARSHVGRREGDRVQPGAR